MKLAIVICTHNRSALLEKTLAWLNQAQRPAGWAVEILVVANACSDRTHAFLQSYPEQAGEHGWLPMRWVSETTPGKSHALNRALPLLTASLVAFVDDDHRVAPDYLVAVCHAAEQYPEATLFCGRIIPDWSGREPPWVRDTGPYRIYPLPVPRYDQGKNPRILTANDSFPGGGNLFLRREVFDRVGGFSSDLGPKGHDLGGGEDSDFVKRALAKGERLSYVPDIVQYHYVDPQRLKLGYILKKGFQRSRSVARVHHEGGKVPLYMWRKLMDYLVHAMFFPGWRRTRFYLVRIAATLGEIRGMAEQRDRSVAHGADDSVPAAPGLAPVVVAMGIAAAAALMSLSRREIEFGTGLAVATGAFFTLGLLIKSIVDFSRTGPSIRAEIQTHFSLYSLYALARLGFWGFALSSLMALAGVAVYAPVSVFFGMQPSASGALISAASGVAGITSLQFLRHLLYLPSTIAASSHYRMSRFYPLWRKLSPARLRLLQRIFILLGAASGASSAATLIETRQWGALAMLSVLAALVAATVRAMATRREPASGRVPPKEGARPPNIVMIGSDTLRADRLGASGYRRYLTPQLDALGKRGLQFTHCYVPCARTAPSLISLLTGTWPHTHGIRDNFVGDDETKLPVPGLPEILAAAGYRTAAVGDWAAGDMGKFRLGFQQTDLPDDQWNIKYLIRQGPKDLRLFLSLFTHNRFGKRFLPELYYLAGVSLTREIGRDARATISRLATTEHPFFLNVFMAATHPPFGSEYPYYTLFSEPDYRGESKFVMARLTDPFEIIRRQGDGKTEFDLEQIIDLYDGCVKSFDDEVGRIMGHIESCGLADTTIVVIYSDHGMEFFEHDTWGQGNSVVGDFSPRVPLIVVDPRQRGGRLVHQLVRSVDVAPTLLELAGVPVPEVMEGRSLVPFLREATKPPNLPAFNETGIWLTDLPGTPEGHLRYPSLLDLLEVPDKGSGTLALKKAFQEVVVGAKDRMVRMGPWKLVYQPLEDAILYRLFQVEDDPDCRHDVIACYPDVAAKLKECLQDWMQKDPVQARFRQRKAAPAARQPQKRCARNPALRSATDRKSF